MMVNCDLGTGLSLGVSRPFGDSFDGFSEHLVGIFLGVEFLSKSFIRSETGVLRLEMRDILIQKISLRIRTSNLV